MALRSPPSPDSKRAPRFDTDAQGHSVNKLPRAGIYFSFVRCPASSTWNNWQQPRDHVVIGFNLGAFQEPAKGSSHFQFPFTEKNPFGITKRSLPGCGSSRKMRFSGTRAGNEHDPWELQGEMAVSKSRPLSRASPSCHQGHHCPRSLQPEEHPE